MVQKIICRRLEITDRRTVADLAYTILATFDSLAYHLYDIKYKGKIYDCWICVEDDYRDVELINAVTTKLSSIGLEENDTMEMEYDPGSPTTFKITYLGSREMERNNGRHYPYIIDGAGRGMLDDMCDFDLKEIVEDIDKKGYSEHYFTPGYEVGEQFKNLYNLNITTTKDSTTESFYFLTTNSCPRVSRLLLRLFIRLSSSTVRPFSLAIDHNVSPLLTI